MRPIPYFTCSGGDLISRDGACLSLIEADNLLGVYRDERLAALRRRDLAAARAAGRLIRALRQALARSARWRRAAGTGFCEMNL
ncbi:MAG: hypothetical protein P4L64_09090 [Caulobacteraceae bacterium]|nr:hypothetical protein [Caulobacteraceae bacterium]